MNTLYQVKAPKFRSRKAFIAWAERVRKMKATYDFERNEAIIQKYLTSQELDILQLSDGNYICNIRALHDYLIITAAIFAGDKEGRLKLRDTVFNHGLSYQIRHVSWELGKVVLEKKYPGKPYKPLAGPDITEFGDYVCLIAIFGNRFYFTHMVKVILDHIDLGHMLVGSYAHVTQQFILRLAEHFLQLPSRQWDADKGNWAFDPLEREPLFKSLWQHWDDENTEILEPLLVQLLNWHTYQASRQNKDGGQDYHPYVEQIPLAYLFILRLRQWRGLSVPHISHVLTQPPFDSLPEEVEGRYEFCPFAKEFYAKTLNLMPDFIDQINRIKIRDWKMII